MSVSEITDETGRRITTWRCGICGVDGKLLMMGLADSLVVVVGHDDGIAHCYWPWGMEHYGEQWPRFALVRLESDPDLAGYRAVREPQDRLTL